MVRAWGATRTLRDHHLRPSRVELGHEPIQVVCLVGDQRVEGEDLDQWRQADRVATLAGQELEAHQVAERVGEGDDLRNPAAFRLAYGLARSPPFYAAPACSTLVAGGVSGGLIFRIDVRSSSSR